MRYLPALGIYGLDVLVIYGLDLWGRERVIPDSNLMSKTVFGKVVLVTGAGGTIGSELCRQIIDQQPEKLIIVDLSEHALFLIDQEMTNYLILKNSKIL